MKSLERAGWLMLIVILALLSTIQPKAPLGMVITVENAPNDLDLGEALTTINRAVANQPARIVVKGGGRFLTDAHISTGHTIVLSGGLFLDERSYADSSLK